MRKRSASKRGRCHVGFVLLLLLHGAIASPAVHAQEAPFEIPELPEGIGEEWGHTVDQVFRVLDEAGELITMTTLPLSVGDVYIDRENNLFEIAAVEGLEARAERKGKAEMPDVSDALAFLNGESQSASLGFLERLFGRPAARADRNEGPIGIYHTHGAESYEPTSGTPFKEGEGDVFRVGDVLRQALEERGYRVITSDDPHLPHDGAAYQRSRRTVAELSQENPVTLIDVHRDAVPDPEMYRTVVNGEQMTAIRLVVGRQNQNREANLEYAKRIKAIADEKYPGLITGIFHAKGNYNQDLGPRMILMEFGTHETTLEEAQRSARLIAEVIPAAAGMAPGTGGAADSQIGSAAARTIGWVLGLALIGGLVWLWMNREGLGLDKLLRGSGGEGDE